jgi:hypothetical protein
MAPGLRRSLAAAASVAMALLLGVGAAAAAELPAVGCPAGGQVGRMAPPPAGRMVADIADAAAAQLAYYRTADGIGVLAPRGWHCFGLLGSNGEQLVVTPESHDSGDLVGNAYGLAGPAVHYLHLLGDTSGRFTIARVVARLFPGQLWFVKQVVAENIEPAANFPTGPFPKDSIRRLGATVVEFVTPGNTEGMGTESRLLKNADPIAGVAVVLPGDGMDLKMAVARLPANLAPLVPVILESVRTAAGTAR